MWCACLYCYGLDHNGRQQQWRARCIGTLRWRCRAHLLHFHEHGAQDGAGRQWGMLQRRADVYVVNLNCQPAPAATHCFRPRHLICWGAIIAAVDASWLWRSCRGRRRRPAAAGEVCCCLGRYRSPRRRQEGGASVRLAAVVRCGHEWHSVCACFCAFVCMCMSDWGGGGGRGEATPHHCPTRILLRIVVYRPNGRMLSVSLRARPAVVH